MGHLWMNPTLSLTYIWFRWDLDETLDFGAGAGLSQDFRAVGMEMNVFAGKDMNLGDPGAECYGLCPSKIHMLRPVFVWAAVTEYHRLGVL